MSIPFRIRPFKTSTKPTLAFIEGTPIGSFAQLEPWLGTQPDGYIEYKVGGKWWAAAKEAQPFKWQDGKVFCSHPSYRSKTGLDPANFSGFFAYEAWQRAKRAHDFFAGIGKIAEHVTRMAGAV